LQAQERACGNQAEKCQSSHTNLLYGREARDINKGQRELCGLLLSMIFRRTGW
jgi:hypothetical protein